MLSTPSSTRTIHKKRESRGQRHLAQKKKTSSNGHDTMETPRLVVCRRGTVQRCGVKYTPTDCLIQRKLSPLHFRLRYCIQILFSGTVLDSFWAAWSKSYNAPRIVPPLTMSGVSLRYPVGQFPQSSGLPHVSTDVGEEHVNSWGMIHTNLPRF